MVWWVVFSFMFAFLPADEEALRAMIEGDPFAAAQEAVLIEYGDSLLLPDNPDLVKNAVLRQFHRMAFQLPQEPVTELVEYIDANWSSLDTQTKNLWREYAGKTGLDVPADVVTDNNLTSLLRYCSETGKELPAVDVETLTDLQRFYYVSALAPEEAMLFVDDSSWAVRSAVLQKNPAEASAVMIGDSSLYLRMNAAKAAGRSDLLMELASVDGPIGPMAFEEVRDVQILEDSLFESHNPAMRLSALFTLLDLGWMPPEEREEQLFEDDYVMVRAVASSAMGRNFEWPNDSEIPADLPPIDEVPDQVVLATDAGEFFMTFLKDAAPLTCRNFWFLAKTGFYDGICFHRVIPGFVAQAGSPEGNGYGGPGYTIPAENNTVPFQRGVVGMADSGMDTAGSQFFIMLDSHRRLDGRYTAFAVLSDTEGLDKIETGTKITGIYPLSF